MIDGDRSSTIALWTVRSISHYYDKKDNGEETGKDDDSKRKPEDDELDIPADIRPRSNKKQDPPKWDFDEAGDVF